MHTSKSSPEKPHMLLPGDPIPTPDGACPNYGDHAPPSATAVPATKHPLSTQLCVLDCLGQMGQRRGRADARPMTNVTEKQPRTKAQILCQITASERAGGSAGFAGSAELGNSHRLTQGWHLAHREGYTAREMSLDTRAPTHSERNRGCNLPGLRPRGCVQVRATLPERVQHEF